MNNEFDLIQLTNTVHWWLSYMSAVGRNFILAESSIKYPLTEYLVQTNPDKIELEYPHPKIKDRYIDIYFENSSNSKSAIEFKFVKNKSATKQRVFNDIIRLYLTLEFEMKAYLIICGAQKDFLFDFQNTPEKKWGATEALPKDAYIRPYEESKTVSKFESKGFYTKWFKFKKNEDREILININNGDEETDKFYKNFLKEYESYKPQDPNLAFKIRTRLLHISDDIDNDYKFYQPSKVGIWEILKE